MKLSTQKITRFTDGKYLIDIVETRSEFEAWIRRSDCGVSDLMFGVPKKQNPEAEKTTFDEFVEMVEANLPFYKKTYVEDHNI